MVIFIHTDHKITIPKRRRIELPINFEKFGHFAQYSSLLLRNKKIKTLKCLIDFSLMVNEYCQTRLFLLIFL